jgi:hypothetical protein
VEKVSSGTFWGKPNLYYQTETSNSTAVFTAPTISYDSFLLLNETVNFADLKTIPLSNAVLSAYRFTSYGNSSLTVTTSADRIEVLVQSNPALPYRLSVAATYFFNDATFQGRQMSPLDFKMDVTMTAQTASPRRVGLATSWWGGGGTLPTGTGNELDVFWKIVSTSGLSGPMNWECARNVTANNANNAPVLVRAFDSTTPAFQFLGFFDATNVNSINWDPTVSVLGSVTSEDGSGPSVGLIVGAAVGAVAGGILIALLIICITRRRIAQRQIASTQLLRERTRTKHELESPK